MQSRIFLIFCLIFFIGETFGLSPPCRPRWAGFQDGCYAFSQDALTWNEAKQECKRHRSELVDIKSKEENNFVGSLSSVNISDFWIGVKSVNCKDENWWLTSGEAAKFTAWEPQQPNTNSGSESCVRINPVIMFNDAPVYGWKNIDCNERLHYACKYYRDPCDEGFSYFNGACYKLERKDNNWEEARINCKNQNSVLVDINNAEENTFIKDLSKGAADAVWIGITDSCKERTWLLLDGTKPSYFNWLNHQPDNAGNIENCASLRTDNGQYNDIPCTDRKPYVCKYTLVQDE